MSALPGPPMSGSREKCAVVKLHQNDLVCACGMTITLTTEDRDLSRYHRLDKLLDRYNSHRKARGW